MTKLPKGLEKIRDESANDYASRQALFYHSVCRDEYKEGFRTATLEILARAQKLADAMKRASQALDSDKFVEFTVVTINDLNEALAEWNEFVESD